jgi:hypothetical protein
MTNDTSKTGFLVRWVQKDYYAGCNRCWKVTLASAARRPFASVDSARRFIGRQVDWFRRNAKDCADDTFVVVDVAGDQVWPSIEVEALRRQVADLTAEVVRLKDHRRWLTATTALQGLLACPDLSGTPENYALDALAYADDLIAKLDGKED